MTRGVCKATASMHTGCCCVRAKRPRSSPPNRFQRQWCQDAANANPAKSSTTDAALFRRLRAEHEPTAQARCGNGPPDCDRQRPIAIDNHARSHGGQHDDQRMVAGQRARTLPSRRTSATATIGGDSREVDIGV